LNHDGEISEVEGDTRIMSDIVTEIENAIEKQDKMHLKDILDCTPPRKWNEYIEWIMIGLLCFGNITLEEYKEKVKCQSQTL